MISAKDALSILKGETLHNFIADMTAQIANRSEEESKEQSAASSSQQPLTQTAGYTKLEESLMMMTISKLLYLDIGTGKCELQHQLTSESSL